MTPQRKTWKIFLNLFSNILGYEDIVKTFVENGADLDAKDEKGLAPIHLAAQKGKY